MLDELKVFAEALTAAQVKELYDEPSKPGTEVTPALQQLWSWGQNSAGQLGNGSTAIRTMQVQAVGLSGIKAIAAGGEHSLAVG